MKRIWIIFTILIPSLGFALECKEIKKDILTLEYRLQNSKVDGCDSCKSKADLTQEYNQALADLVIAEGILSLQLSIEGSHNALNDLSPKDITKANESFKKLDESLDSAALLHEGMKFVSGTTVFSRFQGDTKDELKAYLDVQCKNKVFTGSNFCKEFKKLKPDSKQLETLAGFLNADRQIGNSDRERKNRYTTYQDRLNLITEDGKHHSPQTFKNTPHYKLLEKLKDNVLKFKQAKLKKQNTDSLVEKILEQSKKLKSISFSYKSGNPQKRKVVDFIENNFDKALQSLDLPSLLLEGNIQRNFINTSLRLDNDLKAKRKAFNKEIAKYLSRKNTKVLKGLPLSSTCKGDFGIKCLEKICGVTTNKEPKSCENFQDINFNEKYLRYQEIEKLRKSNGNLSRAQSCFNKDSLKEKQACLINLQTNDSPIAKLREILKQKKIQLRDQSRKAPFPKLNRQKAMAIAQLNSNYCRQNFDKWKFNSPKLDCRESTGIDEGSEALRLGLNGEEIMIKLDTELSKKAVDGLLSKEELAQSEKQLKQQCKKNDVSLAYICESYQQEENFNTAWNDMLEAKQNVVIIDTNPPEDTDVSFTQALDYTARYTLPQLQNVIMSYAQTDFVRDQSNFTIRRINNYDELYMRDRTNFQNYLELHKDLPFITNYGFRQNTYSGLNTFQYNSSSNNNLFANTSPFSYGFTSPFKTFEVNSGNSTPSTTNSSNNVFSFKF